VIVSTFRGSNEALPLYCEVVGIVALHGRFIGPEELDPVVELFLGFTFESQVVVVLPPKSIPFEFLLITRESGAVTLRNFLVLLQVFK